MFTGCPVDVGDDDVSSDDDVTADDDSSGDDDSAGDDDTSGDDDSADDDTTEADQDGDGYDASVDCDDLDPEVHPGAEEVDCDSVDNDCDGEQRPEVHVPAAYPTIQSGIEAAVDGDVVCVQPGTYVENIDFCGLAIRVLGVAGRESTVIDGGGVDCVARFEHGEGPDSVLEGFTLTGGVGVYGGGIHVDSASPTFVSLRVTGNQGYGFGGGIYLRYSATSARDLEVWGNTINGYGGGMEVCWWSDVTLEDIDVSGNTAFDGGGIDVQDSSSLQVLGGVISGNTTAPLGSNGGGLRITESAANLSDVEFTDNEAYSLGGGIYGDDAELVLAGVDLSGGVATHGAGIYTRYSQLVLSSAVLSGNVAVPDFNASGGGLTLEWTTAELSDVLVVDNHVTDGYGGGLYAVESPDFTATRVTVTGNTSTSGGGAFLSGNQADLTNLVIADNEASERGGGLVWHTDGTLTNVIVAGNRAGTEGGGIASWGEHVADLTNVAVTGNTSGSLGGGLYLYGTFATLSGVDLSANAAAQGGGGLWTDEHGNLTIAHTNAFGNTPEDYLATGDPSWTPAGADGNGTAEPQYLDPGDPNPALWDLHLGESSALVDAGNPLLTDPDSSASDIGAYGGAAAAGWDRDQDGYPEWWQPGPYDFNAYPAQGWDCDDRDPAVYPGSGCQYP